MGKGMQAQVCRCGERERGREFWSTHTCMDIWHGWLTLFQSGTRQKGEMRREESMAGQMYLASQNGHQVCMGGESEKKNEREIMLKRKRKNKWEGQDC
jgi:hypothetical protein